MTFMKTCLMFFTVSRSRQTPQSEVISENYNLHLQSAGAGTPTNCCH